MFFTSPGQHIPMNGIARSCGNSMFNLLRNYKIVTQNNWTIFKSHWQHMQVPIPLYFHQHLIDFSDYSHPCWWEVVSHWNFYLDWWQPLWKAVWRYLKKLKMDLPFDPAIPLLGIYPKEPKTLIPKNVGTPMFIAALFTMAKIWKQPKPPSVDQWIKVIWDILLSEISQSEKDKYHRISFICGIYD